MGCGGRAILIALGALFIGIHSGALAGEPTRSRAAELIRAEFPEVRSHYLRFCGEQPSVECRRALAWALECSTLTCVAHELKQVDGLYSRARSFLDELKTDERLARYNRLYLRLIGVEQFQIWKTGVISKGAHECSRAFAAIAP